MGEIEDDLKAAVSKAVAEIKGEAKRERKPAELLVEGQVPADLKEQRVLPSRVVLPKPRPGSSPGRRNPGRTTVWYDGVARNMSESWQKLLESNYMKRYLPDEQLLQVMQELYPGYTSSFFSDVKRVRAAYNSGKLPGMTGVPRVRSYAYVRRAGRVYQVTPRGKVVKLVEGSAARVKPYFGGAGPPEGREGGPPLSVPDQGALQRLRSLVRSGEDEEEQERPGGLEEESS
jgi:hypothetical protein